VSQEAARAASKTEALERTVEVLKRKVIALYEGSEKTALQRQLERSRARTDALQRRRELSELRTAELERYNSRLEADVVERTRTIRRIVDNVGCGFFLVDRELRLDDGYTKKCVELFETHEIAGASLADLLALEGNARNDFQLGFAQLFEDILPEEVTISQLPARCHFRNKVLALQYSPVRQAGGQVEGVLVTMTDATHLEQIERQAELDRSLLAILRQRDAFRAFVSDALEQIANARESISDQVFVRRAVHTLKGNAACYELHEVSALAHRIESAAVISRAELDQLERAIRDFLSSHEALLGVGFASETVFEVSGERVRRLQTMAAEHGVAPGIRRWAAELSLKPLRDLLGPVDEFVARLAARLEKRVVFETSGIELLVDGIEVAPVVAVLPHLLRNALDHGVERPERRGSKPETARVVLEASETGRNWRLSVFDDGAGIDAERVARRAVELGIVSADDAARMDRPAKLQLVFADRLSTAAEVTTVSGRGIGMSAVIQAVRQAGGDLTIESEHGAYTRVSILLPKPAALEAPSARA